MTSSSGLSTQISRENNTSPHGIFPLSQERSLNVLAVERPSLLGMSPLSRLGIASYKEQSEQVLFCSAPSGIQNPELAGASSTSCSTEIPNGRGPAACTRFLKPGNTPQKKRDRIAISLFLWCTFRDSNPGPTD